MIFRSNLTENVVASIRKDLHMMTHDYWLQRDQLIPSFISLVG
ncbi:hypothetical protein SAMN05192561_104143 [Halopenitus malekzadehii]|uniref:Uncharacterized protein n=1 Tax=Halopenitus malekzadehii TaxID=1267564 RepID=A0A1H6J100_9EURY|nr:hypothetical protein SAMN05192561_104143 [Halopenitus malekzadehii]